MINPKISVIIPNWNGKCFLAVCLGSLRSQSFKDIEVIIVDNGSTDGSIEFIKDNYPETIIEQFSNNKGFSAAVNKGIKKSKGDYIFLLNNDTEVDKNCLLVLNNILDKDKEIGFCAVKMLYFNNRSIINDAGDIFSIYGIAHQRGKSERDKGQYNKRELIFGACAGAAIYRRELFDKIGLFDEDFFAYLEDVDFSFRAQLLGFKCLYVPEAVVYHIDGGTSKKINNFSRFLTLRNSIYIIIKNFPLSPLIKFSPFLLASQVRNIFVGIKHKCFRLIIKVYLDFFKNLPVLLKKRKKIQKGKKIADKYLTSIMSKQYPFSIKKSFLEMIKR